MCMMQKRAALFMAGVVVMMAWAGGCRHDQQSPARPSKEINGSTSADPTASLRRLDLSDPAQAVSDEQAVAVSGARNEWVSFCLEVGGSMKAGTSIVLRPAKAQAGGEISLENFQAYQVLSLPVDMSRASYVRHTGLATNRRSLPRALLPLKIGSDGRVDLRTLRDGGAPTALLWIDLHVPPMAAPGAYSSAVQLLADGAPQPLASLQVTLNVYNFNLPNERHLQLVGTLPWDRLEKLYPERFETVTPDWINRRDAKYADTLKTLDGLIALAQANRMGLVIPALRPVTKWPAGGHAEIEWNDLDSVLGPWLDGSFFADHIPLGFWPLPPAEMLDRYDRASQLDYWSQAAAHFEERKWLGRSAVSLDAGSSGHLDLDQARELLVRAAQILKLHPRLRVLLPLNDDQLQWSGSADEAFLTPAVAGRLVTASPALISSPPAHPWPAAVRPWHWLQTDLADVVPYTGAGGSERDVRLWAWLAFLRHLSAYGQDAANRDQMLILWDNTLPSTAGADQPADANDLVWFYPGSWFSVDEPVPTIQLKWLRRAQQDYEYLRLARDRGEAINALQMARLITHAIEIQPGQSPDPVYSLMSGTTDARVWDEAQRLLAESILLHAPGEKVDANAQQNLYIRTMQWAAPRERPLLMTRSADWSAAPASDPRRNQSWVNLKLGVDIYNASETAPEQSRLAWSRVPAGWEVRPQEQSLPRLKTYHITRIPMEQRFNLADLSREARQPLELQFMDSFRQSVSRLRLVLPIAASDRREGRLNLDGKLDDWIGSEPIQDGPLVRMFNRPALLNQDLQFASVPAHLYSAWGRENLYVAFALEGISQGDGHAARNFVDYQQRRAWGEDLCEMLIQPIAADGKLCPLLHVVAKPNGAITVERKSVAGSGTDAWQSVEGAPIRYATSTAASAWQGEIAIPWSLVAAPGADVPPLLRFNFTQHRAANGESATWAGPVDYGRDAQFMGILYVRSPDSFRGR